MALSHTRVVKFTRSVLLCRDYVDASKTKRVSDRDWHVNIKVETNAHALALAVFAAEASLAGQQQVH